LEVHQLNGNRKRVTPALVRTISRETLIEAFQGNKNFLRAVEAGTEVAGPMTLAKAKRYHVIFRNELMRRGCPKDEVDYEPPVTEQAEPEEKVEP
jgi:hypothetical protein